MSATQRQSGAVAVNRRSTRSAGLSANGPGNVVLGPLARRIPPRPSNYISRSTVQRDFTADRPGVKFVGDITYIHTSWIPAIVATV